MKKFDWKKLGEKYVGLSNTMKLASYFIRYTAMGEPDVLLGPVPLYNCTFFDVSISQDILKFRAVEAQFLAHQPATSYAMRIDFLLPTKHAFFINIIMAMYYFGRSIDAAFGPIEKQLGNIAVYNTGFPEALKHGAEVEGDIAEAVLDPDIRSYEKVKNIEYLSQFWDFSKIRLTFPVITNDFIFFDMYIESVFFSKDVRDGDIIKGTVLLRKYIPPPKSYMYVSAVSESAIRTADSKIDMTFTYISEFFGKGHIGVFALGVDGRKKGSSTLRNDSIFGAISDLLKDTTTNKSALDTHGARFTYPGLIPTNRMVYSFGQSDYYSDMLAYIKKDVNKQLVYFFINKFSDWVVDNVSEAEGLKRHSLGNRDGYNGEEYYDVINDTFVEYRHGIQALTIKTVSYNRKFRLGTYDLVFSRNGRLIVYIGERVVRVVYGYVKKLKVTDDYYIDVNYTPITVVCKLW